MGNFEIVIFIMTILIVLSVFADRIRLPYPILLVVVGLIIGFAPFLPDLELDPEIVFLVFLPPILYDAAFKTSWLDFKNEIRPISTLAVTLVLFTTVSVAVAAHYLVPGFTWPLAFVLGAIISPPDAVAATNITKGLGLSRKVITIIEGESLVNDASALIAYRYAVAAVISGTFVIWKAGLQFLLVSIGGIVTGLVVGFILVFAHKRIKENAIVETSLTLLTPFVAYLLAERIHTSGVLSVVSAGLLVSWRSREIFSYRTRLQTKIVWDTVIFLLNGVVFILIGLQLPLIIKTFPKNTLLTMIGYGLVISLVTILIRILWVFAGAYYQQHVLSTNTGSTNTGNVSQEGGNEAVSWKNVMIVAWTGTRGVVSMATALALPLTLKTGNPFPKREVILFLAFIVIMVTLVVQGLTLPLLIRLLKIKPVSHMQKQEEKDLKLSLAESILEYISSGFQTELDHNVVDQLRKKHEVNFNLLSTNKHSNRVQKAEKLSQLIHKKHMIKGQLEILNFQRELLLKYQKEGTFNEDAISKAEAELDIEELRLNTMIGEKSEAAPNNFS